jgi:hypothetical protein
VFDEQAPRNTLAMTAPRVSWLAAALEGVMKWRCFDEQRVGKTPAALVASAALTSRTTREAARRITR